MRSSVRPQEVPLGALTATGQAVALHQSQRRRGIVATMW
ncbi:hypothetical protein BCh11DRAFT_05615 [Burkholderia sp. Ch1-1]|nr:hypothetical protein BCh11DRAFT_05615 [Burkholderia sp. Ch1-1]